jgi:pyruvate dehydrogenase E1 component alpha subunit
MLFDEYEPLKEKMFQVMDYEGKIINSDWMPDISNDEILKAYKTMLLARVLDLKCVSLQRQGRVYTLPPNKGQEASAVGSAWALDDDDWLIPAYRELGAYLTRGLSIENYLWYWLGDERAFSKLKDIRMFPMSVPISSQLTHAVGLGYAINYKNKKEAVITYFGDGGSSKGDFHESVNFGAVFDTPVIFFCNNNQYAISYPRKKQTKTKTIAQKSIAYGIPGIQIDGNDFFAVYRATKEAVNYVKEGNGPVLIESVTYRQGAHTTSDDPSKYRTSEEEKEWEERDPLKRMKAYLMSQGLWDDDKEKEHNDKYNKQVEETFRKVEKYERQKIEDIFDYEYEEMPDSLKKQMMALKKFMSKKKEAK